MDSPVDTGKSKLIVLASGSLYRKRLLKRLVEEFEVAAHHIDESAIANESPRNLAGRLAQAKAKALVGRYPDRWIIGSDQVAVRDRVRLSKPGNYEEAFKQLRDSSGKSVIFFTSVCIVGPGGKKIRTETDVCRVYFRTLTEEQITGYLKREQPFDCAASLKSEGLGIALVEKIEGHDPSALIGLPLILLSKMMEEFGLEVF